ncbi:hypothetical protein OG426_39625 [Streptomyces canus]|uniref:hypothetical protein n=1 Tax=Streptomyces canus TaxID=58343 RepID=UPI00386E893C|nr:hypothetical protein OG426_39625 [Streptomyces canus]
MRVSFPQTPSRRAFSSRSSRRRRSVLLGAATAAALAVAGFAVLLLRPDPDGTGRPPVPVSHVDTSARACLLTSTDTDPGGTWAALRQTADAHLVVQRYRLPAAADPVAYVDTLLQLRCSTVVTTGKEARSAVASRLAKGKVTGVRFVVVADRPLAGAARLSPAKVSVSALELLVRR